MKHFITLLLSLTICFGWAQKDELKALKKLMKSKDTTAIQEALASYESVFENAEDKYKTTFYLYKGDIAKATKEYETAINSYQTIQGLSKVSSTVTTKVKASLDAVFSEINNIAFDKHSDKDFEEASKYFYLLYTINPEDNLGYLYYAAESAVSNEDFDTALEYYIILKDKKYTGISTKYYATEIATGEETLIDEFQFKLYNKNKDYTTREEVTESLFPRILQNIGFIYYQKDEKEKAIAAIKDARAENPGNIDLILTEAQLYIQIEDEEAFKNLMLEAIEIAPNDAKLYFNLGIINDTQGNKEDARKYYEKALELDDQKEGHYLNLVSLILSEEKSLIEEMNGLSTSRADTKRYDVLKQKREDLYKECVPLLEKLVKINPNSESAINTLKNIYGTIGDTEGFKKMKEMLKALEQE